MDSIGIKIRNATISDIEGMATVFDAYRVFNGKTTNISLAKKFLNDRIVSEESTILMARINEGCAGFVQLYLSFSSVNASRILVLNDLYAAQPHRRKGVAKLLMESAVLVVRESNCRGLILETTDDNTKGQSLYVKLGWIEETGQTLLPEPLIG
tara:strand:+ start:1488 stop:1949 length:462 start_codon:yes stop_codon:yes gene_type:complete